METECQHQDVGNMSVCFFRTLHWNLILSEAERLLGRNPGDDGEDIGDGHDEGAGDTDNVTLVKDSKDQMLSNWNTRVRKNFNKIFI